MECTEEDDRETRGDREASEQRVNVCGATDGGPVHRAK